MCITRRWAWFPEASSCAWDLPYPTVARKTLAARLTAVMYISQDAAGVYRFQVSIVCKVHACHIMKKSTFVDKMVLITVRVA